MTKEYLKGMLEYQIRCEMMLNEMSEDSLVYDYALQNCLDGWDFIINQLYDFFPELRDNVKVEDYIWFVLGSIPEIKSEIANDRIDDLISNAEVLAFLIMEYCETWADAIFCSNGMGAAVDQ